MATCSRCGWHIGKSATSIKEHEKWYHTPEMLVSSTADTTAKVYEAAKRYAYGTTSREAYESASKGYTSDPLMRDVMDIEVRIREPGKEDLVLRQEVMRKMLVDSPSISDYIANTVAGLVKRGIERAMKPKPSEFTKAKEKWWADVYKKWAAAKEPELPGVTFDE